MQENKLSLFEAAAGRLGSLAGQYRVPLIAGVITGLLAHGFAMSNKLLNADEVGALFAKGGSYGYGRWLIESTKYIFPNYSMPWIYGILGVIGFTIAACVMLSVLGIENKFSQGLLAAVVVSFPSMTALYCYLFTVTPFALSLLLAVFAVSIGKRDTWQHWLLSAALMILSLGIYQAYVAVAASLYILLMIQSLLQGEKAKPVFLFGVRAVLCLALSLGIYYVGSLLSLRILGTEYANFGVSRSGILYRTALTYNALLKVMTRGYFGLVTPGLSRVLHLVCAAALALFYCWWLIRCRDWLSRLLMLALLVMLPIAMNCVFLMADVEAVHTIVLFSFVILYFLAAMTAEQLRGRESRVGRSLLMTALLLICISNVYLANRTYLKLYLQYENAYAIFTEMITQVKQTEGFDEKSVLAIVGEGTETMTEFPRLDSGDLVGPNQELVNIYTREHFIRYYMGFDIPYADAEETEALSWDPRVLEMPVYPYYGSVQKIDDYIVVKLGENPYYQG